MAARKSARKTKPQPSALQQLTSLLIRGEVGGVVLVFVSAITLLSLLTSSSGVLTGAWLAWIETLFGIGIWGFPLVTGVLGLWMIIRGIENLPDIPWQQPVGLGLLFLSFLMGATLWQGDLTTPAGGEVGGLFVTLIAGAIGRWGGWAFATFLAIAGFVLLTDRFLIDFSHNLMTISKTSGSRRPSIEPVLPLPSGQLPFYKQMRDGWRQIWQRRPNLTLLVRPEPALRTDEPLRSPPPAAQPALPGRASATQPSSDTEILTPRIFGGQEWRLPRLSDMLNDSERYADSDDLIRQQGRIIQETLALFGVPADFEGAYKGPSVTQYLIKPGYVERNIQGEQKRIKVKVAKIAALTNDLALALAAPSVRIEAPIPGTGYVGVEVPNQQGNIVGLKELMESENFQNLKGRLRIAVGEDVKGQPVISDLARMPHLLIAGATGSGKSGCINSIISCLLMTHTPETLRLLMVDPKMVELTTYNGVPHLLSPVVTEVDKAASVLFWAVKEMERRYALFSKAGARDLARYNDYLNKRGEKALPFIVVIVDEMADLMMAAPEEVEKHICRLAQMARAVGIHLIIATQRPSVDVITGLIKANFPSRIAFAVTSQIDSRVILDIPGAERLLGRGDMLFMAPDGSKLERVQGTWVYDEEINRIVRYWKGIRSLEMPGGQPDLLNGMDSVSASPFDEQQPVSAGQMAPPLSRPLTGLSQPPLFEQIEEMKKVAGRDELFAEAVRVVQEAGRGSVSLLQRKLRIGYGRAARLVDQLEEANILGPDQGGALGREVIIENRTSAPRPEGSRSRTQPRIIGSADDSSGNSPTKPHVWM